MKRQANIKLELTEDEVNMIMRALEALRTKQMQDIIVSRLRAAMSIPIRPVQEQIISQMQVELDLVQEQTQGLCEDITLTKAELIKAKRKSVKRWLTKEKKQNGSSQTKGSKQEEEVDQEKEKDEGPQEIT